MLQGSTALQDQLFPWSQHAVLVHGSNMGDRRIVYEGTLYAVAYRIHTIRSLRHGEYRITMPDRMIAPFSYEQEDFERLIGAMLRTRIDQPA